MSRGKIILFVVIGVLLMAAVVFGVLRLNNPLRDSFSGTIEVEEIRILAEVDGQITEISVGEGDLVQEGDLLCQIHSTLLSSQVEQAKAVVSASQAQLSKAKNGATLEDLAIAQANLEYAQATLTLAMEMLAKGQVKAPQSGTILERDINPGELVSQGGMLFSLADLDHLFLYIYLAQDQIGWAQLGQNVTVKVPSHSLCPPTGASTATRKETMVGSGLCHHAPAAGPVFGRTHCWNGSF